MKAMELRFVWVFIFVVVFSDVGFPQVHEGKPDSIDYLLAKMQRYTHNPFCERCVVLSLLDSNMACPDSIVSFIADQKYDDHELYLPNLKYLWFTSPQFYSRDITWGNDLTFIHCWECSPELTAFQPKLIGLTIKELTANICENIDVSSILVLNVEDVESDAFCHVFHFENLSHLGLGFDKYEVDSPFLQLKYLRSIEGNLSLKKTDVIAINDFIPNLAVLELKNRRLSRRHLKNLGYLDQLEKLELNIRLTPHKLAILRRQLPNTFISSL